MPSTMLTISLPMPVALWERTAAEDDKAVRTHTHRHRHTERERGRAKERERERYGGMRDTTFHPYFSIYVCLYYHTHTHTDTHLQAHTHTHTHTQRKGIDLCWAQWEQGQYLTCDTFSPQ